MPQPIVNPLWPGPCLLTPMTLEALLVGSPNQGQTWAQTGMMYKNITAPFAPTDPAPQPFQNRPVPPAIGIHLHWTLPYALRHGTQVAQGASKVNFPPAPNRWLVTRFFRANPGDAPTMTAWLVESDYMGPQATGTNPFPTPGNPKQITYLGRQVALADWNTTPGPANSVVSAPGPGELAWSLIYDNVENVFAFFDPASQTGSYSYSVVGWYATPGQDPLFGDPNEASKPQSQWQSDWLSLLDGMSWGVGSSDDKLTRTQDAVAAFRTWLAAHPIQGGPAVSAPQQMYASQTLCHGLLFNIAWQGPNFAYPLAPILTSGNPPAVAIGSTAPEAVGAWMGNVVHAQNPAVDPVQVENLLVAFQLGRVLDFVQDTGFPAVAHAARFGHQPGGTAWTVAGKEQTGDDGSGGEKQVALSQTSTSALTALIDAQQALDNANEVLYSLQWELFAANWKLQQLSPVDPSRGTVQTWVATLSTPGTGLIPALNTTIAGLTTDLSGKKAALDAGLAKEPPYVSKAVAASEYHVPDDPVVLLAGAQGDTKLEPPVIPGTSEFSLLVRFTGQTLGGLQVSFTGIDNSLSPVSLLAADLLGPLTLPAGGPVPKECPDLWLESLLLDVSNSGWLAKLAFQKAGASNPTPANVAALADRISKQQTLVWNADAQFLDQGTVAEAAGLLPLFPGQNITIPSKGSVAAFTPPWTPLYLDWQITWYPSAQTPPQTLAPWSLAQFDYSFTGSAAAPAAGAVQGRTVLNSKFPKGLSGMLSDFLTTPAVQKLPAFEVAQLQQTVSQFARMDVLTQSLTGLTNRMIMRRIQATGPVGTDATKALVGDALTWIPAAGPGDAPGFYPIRAGHFQLNQLRVVDAFGQIYSAFATQGGGLLPTRSQSLTASFNSSLMQLTPRFSQTTRLNFSLVDAEDDTLSSDSSDLTNPICGWLLPNHLDESVLVFDAAGNSLGEILKVQLDSGPALRWDATPGSDAAYGAPPAIPNAHFSRMINALLTLGMNTTAPLDDLLDLIDVTLWTTDPLGSPRQGNLSVLLGRPIAVVRGSIAIQIAGNPAWDQSWAQTGKQNTQGFTSVPVGAFIGSHGLLTNGTLGYFESETWNQCYAMDGYQPSMGAVRRAVAPRVGNSLARVRTLLRTPAETGAPPPAPPGSGSYVATGHRIQLAADGLTEVFVTMLVDPRGSIPAITGMHPVEYLSLAPGPVSAALTAMAASFRMGPVLLDPNKVSMPLPSDIQGKWSWIERTGVTFWSEKGPLAQPDSTGDVPSTPPTLREGWLKLSGGLVGNAAQDSTK